MLSETARRRKAEGFPSFGEKSDFVVATREPSETEKPMSNSDVIRTKSVPSPVEAILEIAAKSG
jgi:hypothetical protein